MLLRKSNLKETESRLSKALQATHVHARPIALVAACLLASPLAAVGQSDETCIVYMEADAAYHEAFTAVRDGAEEAGSKAYTAVMLPHKVRHIAAYSAANKAGFEPAQETDRRCGGFVSKAGEAAMRLACEAKEAAYRRVLEAYGVDDKAAEKQATRAQMKAAEDFKKAATNDAREQRDRAYRNAYEGPTSKVASVMRRLIKTDRKRCRERFGR